MSTESSKGQDIYEQDLSSFDNTSTIVDKETLKKNNDEENSLSEEDNNVIPRKENFIEKKKRETENKNTEGYFNKLKFFDLFYIFSKRKG